MNRVDHRRFRFASALRGVTMALCLLTSAGDLTALAFQQEPAPIERRPPGANPAGEALSPARNNGAHRRPLGEHLAEWMNQHSSLTPQQQQQALEREPGFHQLPTQTQQRVRDRLAQLDAMPPERRQRIIARTEAMERLNPDQRAEVRGALGQLGSLPLEQRHQVAHTFRALRDLPAEQRVQAYNSGRFGPPLNDAQRTVLMNLLRVEPMLPPPAPTDEPRMPAMGQAFR